MRDRLSGARRGIVLALVLLASIVAHATVRHPPPRPAARAVVTSQTHILRHPEPIVWQRWDGLLHAVWRWAARAHALSTRD